MKIAALLLSVLLYGAAVQAEDHEGQAAPAAEMGTPGTEKASDMGKEHGKGHSKMHKGMHKDMKAKKTPAKKKAAKG